jgi:hypothetical protein
VKTLRRSGADALTYNRGDKKLDACYYMIQAPKDSDLKYINVTLVQKYNINVFIYGQNDKGKA